MYALIDTPNQIVNIESLTNSAQTVFAAGAKVRIGHIVCAGGAAAEIVIFRAIADTPVYMQVNVPIGDTVVVPGWVVGTGGLEVITASAAGDVNVAVFYRVMV